MIELPLRIESTANQRLHHHARARQTKAYRNAAMAVPRHPLPCVVRLIRVAPRPLDDDNLSSAFKALRDGIADKHDVKDNDPRMRFEYDQVRGAPNYFGVRIDIRPMD